MLILRVTLSKNLASLVGFLGSQNLVTIPSWLPTFWDTLKC